MQPAYYLLLPWAGLTVGWLLGWYVRDRMAKDELREQARTFEQYHETEIKRLMACIAPPPALFPMMMYPPYLSPGGAPLKN